MDSKEKIEELDRMALEIARQQKLVALANAKTALAEQEKNDYAYKLVVMQIFMKYKLTPEDSLSEDGTIVRGGNVNSENV